MKTITLPSIASQENFDFNNLKVILLTSSDIPQNHKTKLESLCQKYPWLNISYQRDDVKFNIFRNTIDHELKILAQQENKDIIFASLRLDDDDAISKNFLQQVKQYLTPNFIGFGLSFLKGYSAIFDKSTNTFTHFHPRNAFCIAIGLGLINSFNASTNSYSFDKISVYDLGNHLRISEVVPVISCANEPYYLRTVYYGQDSDTQKTLKALNSTKEIELLEVKKHFPFV